jgi:hypothetical protein
LAGAGLASFASGLLGLYLKTPGMRRPGSLGPTEQGTPLAKDVWMAGIGAALVLAWLAWPRPAKEQPTGDASLGSGGLAMGSSSGGAGVG